MAIEDLQLNPFYYREMIMDQNVYEFGYRMNQMENTGIYDTTELIIDTISPDDCKRSRDCYSFDPSFPDVQFVNQNQPNRNRGIISFFGQDISMQMYQHEQEIDWFIAHYTETMRSEIEATGRRDSMRLIEAVEERIEKRLRSKEEEIVKIGRRNRALEEKVKSLSVENQIWQQMAQTNEDRANVLLRNLHQVLTQQHHHHHHHHHAGKITVDDVESRCGSNQDDEYQQRRMLAKVDTLNQGNDVNAYCTTSSDSRWCRNCGKQELCVLLLPCRHLCICTECESSVNFCPICKCSKTASVHVNMNSF